MRWWLRHLLVAAVSGILVTAFLLMRAGAPFRPGIIHPIHLWNRAFADAAIVVLALVMLVGPLVRLIPAAAPILPFRRELGWWCYALSITHVMIYAQGAFGWNFGLFVYSDVQHPVDAWRTDAWAAANWAGIAALLYGLLPFATSNAWSERRLAGGWKWLQQQSIPFYVLSMLHVFLFNLLVYKAGGGQGPLWSLFWFVLIPVAVMRGAAFWLTLSRKRQASSATLRRSGEPH